MKSKKTAAKRISVKRVTGTKSMVKNNPVTMRTWVLFVMFLAISVYSMKIILANQ